MYRYTNKIKAQTRNFMKHLNSPIKKYTTKIVWNIELVKKLFYKIIKVQLNYNLTSDKSSTLASEDAKVSLKSFKHP